VCTYATPALYYAELSSVTLMRYSAPQLVAFCAASLILTCGTVVGVRFLVIPTLEMMDADHVARFVYQYFLATSVQWCTFCAFFFALIILTARAMEQRAIRKSLVVLRRDGTEISRQPANLPSQFVARRVSQVETCCQTKGPTEALSLVEAFHTQNTEGSAAVFGLLGTAVQLMLAMGFFGTVWGISRSMFQSFTGLAGTTAAQVSGALGQFTSGLSTALDTTVTGLVCAIVSGLLIAAVEWAEQETLTDLAAYLRECVSRGGPDLEMDEQRVVDHIVPLLREMVHKAVAATHEEVSAEEESRREDKGQDVDSARA
jgi:biopolymer transport protein ExbB/TolQ